MAFLEIKNVALKGVAACVPAKTVETKDIPLFSNNEAEKFTKITGIERRRIVSDGIITSDLCFTAAERLISDLQWNKMEIDALIFVSNTPDFRTPATSCILDCTLVLVNVPAITLPIYPSTSNAIHEVSSFLLAPTFKFDPVAGVNNLSIDMIIVKS